MRRALVLALLVLSAGAAALAPAHGAGRGAEVAFQPCLSGEGRCASPPVATSDGRLFVDVVPLYTGSVDIYVEGERGPLRYAYTCTAPAPAGACARLVDAGRAGTYVVVALFRPSAQGALLLEAMTSA